MPVQNEDGSPLNSVQEQQFELLGAIHVTMTANPTTVAPFGTTKITWTTTIPTTLHVPVTFVLDGATVPASGSKTITVVETSEFALTAKTAIVSRVLQTVTITANTAACKTTVLPGFLIAGQLSSGITTALSGSSQFSLTGAGVAVTVANGSLAIAIPLHIDVPDWFDADMSVAIKVAVGETGIPPNRTLSVSTTSVDVDVSFGTLSSIFSGGCSALVAKGMEQMAKAFMTEIVNNQVNPLLVSGIMGQVTSAIASAKSADVQKRTYALTSLVLTTDGVSFTICPEGGLTVGGLGGTK